MDILVDLVRVGHLMALAVGIGSAVFLETTVLARARYRIDAESLALIKRGHHMIFGALAALWLTGLILTAVRTGLDPALFTPKLQTKFIVVGILTTNALVIGWVVTPLLHDSEGMTLDDLETWELMLVGAAAGLSGAGWLSALLLGAVSAFKPMGPEFLTMIFATILAGGVCVGAAAAVILGRAPRELSVFGAVRHAFSSRDGENHTLNRVREDPHAHGIRSRAL